MRPMLDGRRNHWLEMLWNPVMFAFAYSLFERPQISLLLWTLPLFHFRTSAITDGW